MDFALLNASVMGAFAERDRVLYTPARNDPPFQVRGVFDRYQVEVSGPEGGPPTMARRTVLGVLETEFPPGFRHQPYDKLTLRGVTYDVTSAEPDGMGWVTLHLGRIA